MSKTYTCLILLTLNPQFSPSPVPLFLLNAFLKALGPRQLSFYCAQADSFELFAIVFICIRDVATGATGAMSPRSEKKTNKIL